jgi:predicted phosphodiesterase
MDIYYISDLHLEYIDKYKKYIDKIFDIEETEIILVLSGDICSYDYLYKLKYLLEKVSKFKYILYVPGNHEYYTKNKNSNMNNINEKIKEMASIYKNIYYLNNETINIGKYKFVGSTLWTHVIGNNINDFEYIFIENNKLTIEKYNEIHNKCKKYLEDNINKCDDLDIIVITHHVPSLKVIHKTYKKYKQLTQYFNVDMEYLFKDVKYWICGHTHKKMNEIIDNCNVLINPAGYPGENYFPKLEKLN